MIKYDVLKILRGKLTICAYVQRKNTTYLYYKRTEDKTVVRNVYQNSFYGFKSVHIPGFKYGCYYSGPQIEEKEPWSIQPKKMNCNLSEHHHITDKEIAMFEKIHPGFHYVIEKCEKHWYFGLEKFFDILEIWKKHPQIEILLDKGFSIIALNKNFWKVKPETMKKYIAAMKNVPEGRNPTLAEIQWIIKGGTLKTWDIAHNPCFYDYKKRKYVVSCEEIDYILKKEIAADEYADYKFMAKEIGHDMDDPYWKFPQNFKRMHQKVIREHKNIIKMKDLEKLKPWQEKYAQKVKKFCTKFTSKDGICVYVPQDIKEYPKHADKLHQCLVFASYYEDVAKGKKILAFLTKNDVPYATAELLKIGKKFKLNQFYGDERNRSDYGAKPDARNAFFKWIQKSKINLVA